MALAVVGVDVAAVEGGQGAVGDDVAADHRAAAGARVGVGEDRLASSRPDPACPSLLRRTAEALDRVPAEVGAAGRGDGRVVDLLEAVLADVADRDPRVLPGR